jgi:hypothetical protein
MQFTSTPRGARLARRLVSHRLHEWGHPYGSTANETITLIAAELVANAVRRARTRAGLPPPPCREPGRATHRRHRHPYGEGAQYDRADGENGDHIDDPSEDALFMLIDDLNDADNTFVVIQPDEDDPVWFASVAVLD